ncbi:hypothetical protein GC169_05000 [bacterium]|nr:hypothetical protein [bacterium]
MRAPLPHSRPTPRPGVWVIGWLAACLVLSAWFGAAAVRLDLSDPDSSLRLVAVRDLLAGRNWFDPVQERLFPPDGVAMHWARWIDGALAVLIGLLQPVLGPSRAEVAAGFIWPFGLLAAFTRLTWLAAREIGDMDGLRVEAGIAATLATATAFPVLEKFGPGGFDHHGVQAVLVMAAVLGLMRLDRWRWGAAAGGALAAAMGTAAESLPFAAVGAAAAGLIWAARPDAAGKGFFAFGAAFALTTIVFFLLLAPPTSAGPVCDAMSPAFLGLGLAAGGGAMALAVAGSRLATFPLRLVAGAAVGVITLLGLGFLAPECLSGGYAALPADLKTNWMAQIAESRSAATLAHEDPGLLLALGGVALTGLAAAAAFVRKTSRDPRGWILLGFLVAALGVFVWQVRGAFFATALALPVLGWAIARARRDWREARGAAGGSGRAVGRAAVFALVLAGSLGAVWSAVGVQVQTRFAGGSNGGAVAAGTGPVAACYSGAAIASLDGLPTGLMFNPFAIGPAVLLHSRQSAVAGPYHRNVAGLTAVVTAMRSTPEAARPVIEQTGADYVLVCPPLPEGRWFARHPVDPAMRPEDTLAGGLQAGKAPAWLTPVEGVAAPLRVYRIIRAGE